MIANAAGFGARNLLQRLSGKKATLDFVTLLPRGVSAQPFMQRLKGIGGELKPDLLPALKVSNGGKATKAVFLHVLAAMPAESKDALSAELAETKEGSILTVKTPKAWRFRVRLDRPDAAEPVLEVVRAQ